jgi:predicted HTH domain antitoxin
MRTITLNIPDNVELDNTELSMHLTSRLYEQGKLSLGQAAHLQALRKERLLDY